MDPPLKGTIRLPGIAPDSRLHPIIIHCSYEALVTWCALKVATKASTHCHSIFKTSTSTMVERKVDVLVTGVQAFEQRFPGKRRRLDEDLPPLDPWRCNLVCRDMSRRYTSTEL